MKLITLYYIFAFGFRYSLGNKWKNGYLENIDNNSMINLGCVMNRKTRKSGSTRASMPEYLSHNIVNNWNKMQTWQSWLSVLLNRLVVMQCVQSVCANQRTADSKVAVSLPAILLCGNFLRDIDVRAYLGFPFYVPWAFTLNRIW